MKIAVCDDEKIFRDEIAEILYEHFGKLDTDIVMYESGEQLLGDVGTGKTPEVCFLDIEMPGADGFETAKKVRKMLPELPVIFLTSHTERAMDGYEVKAFRFLAKPVNSEKLIHAIEDLQDEMSAGKNIFIHSDGEDIILDTDKIIYIEAQNNCVRYVSNQKEYLVREKISSVERELKEMRCPFFRIHRGYLVNLKHVTRHLHGEVFMDNDEVLPLARTCAAAFKEKLLEYVRRSAR